LKSSAKPLAAWPVRTPTAARIGDHPQIIAFRNVLIHGYDLVDDTQVWGVITQDLPTLEQQVLQLLNEAPPPS
jgi:uncharacterized protein with HEPN domain